ncbi:hypothetical protein D3C72_1915130 [compost metagenome]
MPISAGSPMCTGAPWVMGKRAVISMARTASAAFSGRMETTILPARRPAGLVSMAVRYMATLRPSSICRSGTPASSRACSKEKEQPMAKATKSASQSSPISVTSSKPCPRRWTR